MNKSNNNEYANINAGDAFIAGHFGEWTNAHKNQITKSQFAHLVALMETYSMDIYEGTQNPDKMAKHLNLIFKDINEKIMSKEGE